MKRMVFFPLVLTLIGVLFVTGCGNSGPNEENQINAVLDKAAASVQGRVLSQFLECVADPFIYNTVTTTHEDMAGVWLTMPSFTLFEFTNRAVTISGSTATVTCLTRQKIGGGSVSEAPSTINLTKNGGQWFISDLENAT